MEYRYPPLYKYIALFIILFLFFRHYKQFTQDKYLILSLLITSFVMLLDYMLIYNHPNLLHTDELFDPDFDLDNILDHDIVNSNINNYQTNNKPGQKLHCNTCNTTSELPVLKPIIYDICGNGFDMGNGDKVGGFGGFNAGNAIVNDYSEIEMRNMMDAQSMQNMQMQDTRMQDMRIQDMQIQDMQIQDMMQNVQYY